ncbi:MAG TPA: hypothetical protein DER05_02070 [Lutibacter sp.]|nr:hypothetical protein [Lutibacter sp.]
MSKQLPKNWIEVSLKEVTNNKKGKKPNIQSEVEFNGAVPYMDIKALEYNEIRQYADVESSKLFEEGDVAMVWDGARSGWVSKTNFGAIGSTLVAFHPILFNSNYLFYYLLEKYPFINSNARGVGIPHVDPTILWDLKFPLSPLSEQNRIVEKLDNLFNQLDSIKKSMSNIPLLLKDFRQQILTQAVTGKLTVEWRKGKKLEKWNYELAQDCCEKVQSGGTPKGSNFDTSGIPFLKVYNIVNNKIDFEYNPQYVSESIQNSQIKKSITFPGDVVMNIVGPPLNKIAIIPDDYPEWNLNQAITLFRTKNYLSNTFLYYFFCEGSSVKSLINETKGVVGQVNISLSQCRNFSIPVPSPKEQHEIVSKVESLFAKADAIEQQYKSLKEKIDNLPQSLLHKAFKGELSEQLDGDGDARVLLKEIETLKNSVKKPKKK